MPTKLPRMLLEVAYEEAAREYQRNLPPEHYMEATPHSTQRKITLESLDLVHAKRPDIHVFNELLVQYPVPGTNKPNQVVPDNTIVIHPHPILAMNSYKVPLQPARPFCMLEYVSSSNARKDYADNMQKYERELKVPYYVLFRPEAQELTLYCHDRRKFQIAEANVWERFEIPELELEVAILDSWMRFWFRGKLLPLPGELQGHLDVALQALAAERTEVKRLRAELEALKKSKKNGRS